MSNKTIYVILGVFAVVLVASIVTSRKVIVSVSGHYRDDELGFSIRYPESWEKRIGFQGTSVAFVSPKERSSDRFQESVNVVMTEVEEGTVLNDQLLQEFYAEIESQGTGFQVLETQALQLNGVDARRITCRFRVGGHLFQYLLYILLKDDRVYVITCVSRTLDFDRYEGVFDRMCRSIQID